MSQMYQCEGTWFVGIDALNNDATGEVGGSGPLTGCAVDFVQNYLGGWPGLHRAQMSGVFPGYPRPRATDTEAGFRYRQQRDGAHVDGVIGRGEPRRRFVEEPHAFILGLPLTLADPGAAPLVVWEGSHVIIKEALRMAIEQAGVSDPSRVDVTEAYVAARRHVFQSCRRVEVQAQPGSAILLHRLLLHGVAPWREGATSDPPGRLIAYFRPPMPGGAAAWIAAP